MVVKSSTNTSQLWLGVNNMMMILKMMNIFLMLIPCLHWKNMFVVLLGSRTWFKNSGLSWNSRLKKIQHSHFQHCIKQSGLPLQDLSPMILICSSLMSDFEHNIQFSLMWRPRGATFTMQRYVHKLF